MRASIIGTVKHENLVLIKKSDRHNKVLNFSDFVNSCLNTTILIKKMKKKRKTTEKLLRQ